MNVQIPPLDSAAESQARRRWDSLTKPQGSLGLLEDLGTRLAGMTGQVPPPMSRKVIFTVAADHGVVQEGVSPYPQSVTAQMVMNFLKGGAGINVLARQAGAEVVVVDAGVATEFPSFDGLIRRPIRAGTANFVREPAMSRQEARRAVEMGFALFEETHRRAPIHLTGLGDMGIGNTTSSAALTSLWAGCPVAEAAGRGAGLDESGLQRKIQVIEAALQRHRPDPQDPWDVLSKVGGLEIGCLAGIALSSAQARVPVVLDGFITTAAALLAWRLAPEMRGYFIASHRSVEPGHAKALAALGLEPLLDLQLRLGEGTGAALAFSLIEASCRLLSEMATFEQAGVDRKKE